MSPVTTHARLSPSGSKRWINCPGSVAATEGMHDPGSEYAWEGTAAHEVLERSLQGWLRDKDSFPEDHLGAVIEVVKDWENPSDVAGIEVTQEMVDAVRVAFDYVVGQVEGNPGVVVHLERRVSFEAADPPEGLDGGTCDITLWYPDGRLQVIDYKHGRGVLVEVEDNTQAILYALGAVLTDRRKPRVVITTIIQPRAFHEVGPVRSHTYMWGEMVEWKEHLWERAAATQEPRAPLAVGDWCRFCLAAPTCPAKLAQANEVAGNVFQLDPPSYPGNPADALEPVVDPAEKLPVPEQLDTEQLAFIVQHAPEVMDWLRTVEAHVTSLLERGVHVPGFKLVEGRSNRQWVDAEAAERYLARKGLKRDERFNLKVISPAQAERVLKARGEDLSRIRLGTHITKPEGKPKLAPADSPKPALTPSVETAFELSPPSDDAQTDGDVDA